MDYARFPVVGGVLFNDLDDDRTDYPKDLDNQHSDRDEAGK